MNDSEDFCDKDSQELAQDRTAWAEDRTDWAEDRTILANERTFAGWMRTGIAMIGLGLALRALFGEWEPFWIPRGIASIFIVIGIFVIFAAQKRSGAVLERLNSHSAKPVSSINMRIIATLMIAGATCLLAGIWFFKVTML